MRSDPELQPGTGVVQSLLFAYAAAGIAGSPPMRTGLLAWKAAKALYVVVFLFAYTNLLDGSWVDRIRVGSFALAGLFALTAALAPQRHEAHPILRRLAWILTAASLLLPFVLLNIAGAVALVTLMCCSGANPVRRAVRP